MTLLIACILINAFGLGWGWYVATTLIWVIHVLYHAESQQIATRCVSTMVNERQDSPALCWVFLLCDFSLAFTWHLLGIYLICNFPQINFMVTAGNPFGLTTMGDDRFCPKKIDQQA